MQDRTGRNSNVPKWLLGLLVTIAALPGLAATREQADSSGASVPADAVIRTWEYGANHDLGDGYACRVFRGTGPTGSQYWLKLFTEQDAFAIPFQQLIPLLILAVRIREHPPTASAGLDGVNFSWEWNGYSIWYDAKEQKWMTTIRVDYFEEEGKRELWPAFLSVLERASFEMESMKKIAVSQVQK